VQGTSELTAAKNCITIVNSNSTVYFRAGERIILMPGFVAASGAKFVAYLDISPSATTPEILTESREATPKNNISISPNPFRNSFVLTITSNEDQKAQVTIYNSLGIKVKESQSVSLSKGFNTITFSHANLAKGVYLAEINIRNVITVKKIVRM
jgi:hypothetical protein